MKKKDILIILLLVFSTIPSVLPLLHHGFFQTDDGEWMIIRLSAFYQALHDGQFPVRFLQRLNFGYGYPVAEFLYPGSFYLASLLHIIRFGFVNSIKILFGLSLVGSAFFTYLWLNKIFSKLPSFIGSLIALYLPYHLDDVYKRGSVEVFALLWVPFIFWQIERGSFFFTAIGITLLIISHNTLAVLLLPLVGCVMASKVYKSKKKKQTIYSFIYSLLLSLGLSTFFWLPILFELPKTVFSSTLVSQWSNYFATMDQIGIVSYLILVAILLLFIFKKTQIFKHILIIIFFVISVISVFMATAASSWLWSVIPSNFIQFPFRFLSVIVVTLPFLAAFTLSFIKGKWQWVTTIVLLFFLIYSSLPFIQPVAYFDKGEGYYYTNDATTTVKDEYMPIWVRQKLLSRPKDQVIYTKGSGSISNIITTNNFVSFVVNTHNAAQIQVNRVYWPGWYGTVDGKSVPVFYNNPYGAMSIVIPTGKHMVVFSFRETPLRIFADIVSIVSFLLLCLFSSKNTKKRKN